MILNHLLRLFICLLFDKQEFITAISLKFNKGFSLPLTFLFSTSHIFKTNKVKKLNTKVHYFGIMSAAKLIDILAKDLKIVLSLYFLSLVVSNMEIKMNTFSETGTY